MLSSMCLSPQTDRRKLQFFRATVLISELFIAMYEINASMLVLSDYFFELQDMSRAQVILRGF